jgi:hypothetical protein
MIESMQALFGAMVDYAGMFPPASLTLDAAVADYARINASADAWLVGRFVISAGRLRDFERLAPRVLDRDDEPWVLSVLLPADPASSLSEINTFNEQWTGRARIAAVEFASLPIENMGALVGLVPSGVEIFFETPLDADFEGRLDAVNALGAAAKVRTGGIKADAIPPVDRLAVFLKHARDAGVAFKATAGLHHALRGSYPLTYRQGSDCATMYGFLNLVVAAAVVYSGGSAHDAMRALEESSPDAFRLCPDGLSWRRECIGMQGMTGFRQRCLRSFASCDFREPVADLRRLGWL